MVYSSAVKPGNPEFDAARLRGLPLVRRAEMLAEIMRLKWCVAVAGTNGKTTTTTMVAALLDAGALDPTVVNGGIINAYGTNARLGAGEWVVVEADESDGTFLRLPATVSVVTNIDPDHLDYYGSFDKMREAFLRFVENVPVLRLCGDVPGPSGSPGDGRPHPRPPRHHLWLQPPGRCARRRCVASPKAPRISMWSSPTGVMAPKRASRSMRLPMPGEHNVQNALAAIVVARELGVPDDTIRTAFAGFGGVGRRFTRVGEWNGCCHHRRLRPQPLQDRRGASCGAPGLFRARSSRWSSRIAIRGCATPSSSSRPVSTMPMWRWSPRSIRRAKLPIPGIDRDSYAEALRAHGHRHVRDHRWRRRIWPRVVAEVAKPGGAVVCLGAGSITGWAAGLETALKAREGKT